MKMISKLLISNVRNLSRRYIGLTISRNFVEFSETSKLKFENQLKSTAKNKNNKLNFLLSNDLENKILEESLTSSVENVLGFKFSSYHDLLLNSYIYYKENLGQLISIPYFIKYNEIKNSLNNWNQSNAQFTGLNHFTYDYFHLTVNVLIKKYDYSHEILGKKINENFEANFNRLDAEGKLFITQLSTYHNVVSQINVISSYYNQIFSKNLTLFNYSQEVEINKDLNILLNEFHLILRFYGLIPIIMREENSKIIINLYHIIYNLSSIIFKNSLSYFNICYGIQPFREIITYHDATLLQNVNNIIFRYFELCDSEKMPLPNYIEIISGYLTNFSDDIEYTVLSNNFLERFLNTLNKIKVGEYTVGKIFYLIIKYFHYDMCYNTNFKGNDTTTNALILKRSIIWSLYEIFLQHNENKSFMLEHRITCLIILKNLFHINFNKNIREVKMVLENINTMIENMISSIDNFGFLIKSVCHSFVFMSSQEIELYKKRIEFLSKNVKNMDFKNMDFNTMNELIFKFGRTGLDTNFLNLLKDDYFAFLFKVNLEGKLEYYDLYLILNNLKIFTNNNSLQHIDNIDYMNYERGNYPKMLTSNSNSKKKFEEFRIEVEIPNFLEKLYFTLNQDKKLLIKDYRIFLLGNLCELTHLFCPELLRENYISVIYPFLNLHLDVCKTNRSLLILMQYYNTISYYLSLQENKTNLQYHLKLICKLLLIIKSRNKDNILNNDLINLLGRFKQIYLINSKNYENTFETNKKPNFLKYILKRQFIELKNQIEKKEIDSSYKGLKIMKNNLEEQEFI